MSNLLARANTDYEIAKLLLSEQGNPTHDEMITDQAAYHIQQAIEKALKYQLEMKGISYQKTHNLLGLITQLEQAGFAISDELKNKSVLISNWEAMSRYGEDNVAVAKDIEAAISLYQDLEADILANIEKNI